jgi:hypothetical protein
MNPGFEPAKRHKKVSMNAMNPRRDVMMVE